MTRTALARPEEFSFSLREGVFLAIVTLVGAWVRGRALDGFAISHWDEGAAWAGALWFLTWGEHGHYSPLHSPPLVPAAFAGAMSLLKAHPDAAVLVNIMASTATIPLLYFFTWELYSSRVAGWATILLATSGLHVMFARSLLTESNYILFLVAALLCSVLYLRTQRVVWIAGASVAAICLQYTKYNGFLVTLPLLATLAYQWWRGPVTLETTLRRSLLLVVPVCAAIAANVLALIVVNGISRFVGHYSEFINQNTPTLTEVVRTLVWAWTPLNQLNSAQIFGLGWIHLFLAVAGFVITLRSHRFLQTTILHLAVLIYIVFLFRYSFYLRLLLPVATLLLVYQAVALEAATCFLSKWSPFPRLPILQYIVLVLLALPGTPLSQTEQDSFGGYDEASAFLNAFRNDVGRLFVTQDYVWIGLDQPIEGVAYGKDTAAALLADASEKILLVLDVHAFSRLRMWNFTSVMDQLEAYRLTTVPNPLNRDILQAHLTREELLRWNQDADLRDRVLSIHIFLVPRHDLDELMSLATNSRPSSVDESH